MIFDYDNCFVVQIRYIFFLLYTILVDLTKVRSADSPIVIDTSPPIPGTVYDGPVYEHDLSYTKENSEVRHILI